MRNSISINLVLCLWLGCWSAPVAMADTIGTPVLWENSKRVDALLNGIIKPTSPGCAVAVWGEGRPLHLGGYGMASLELDNHISADTVFNIGSSSKQFAAAAIVHAALAGKLGLGDDIRQYLPEFPDYGHVITINHLVFHTSGIRDYMSMRWMAGQPPEDIYSDAWVMDLLMRQKALNFVPGETYSYSNSGYFLMAKILEVATGQSLRLYADENLFQPLGMDNTHFHNNRHEVVPNRSMAYAPGQGGSYRLDWYANFDKIGSGGLMTSARDLMLWEENFHKGMQAAEGWLSKMKTLGVLGDGHKSLYGYGLIHGQYKVRTTIRHRGAYMGYRAETLRFPDQGASIDVICNYGGLQPARLAEAIADILFNGTDDQGAVKKMTASDHQVSVEALDQIAGAYRDTNSRYILTLSRQDNSLTVQGAPFPLRLVQTRPGHFQSADENVPVKMFIEGPGAFSLTTEGLSAGHYEKVELVDQQCGALAAHAGRYRSAELGTEFLLAHNACQITVQRGKDDPVSLTGTTAHAFRSGILTLEFDGRGGLLASVPRAGGVQFQKQ